MLRVLRAIDRHSSRQRSPWLTLAILGGAAWWAHANGHLGAIWGV